MTDETGTDELLAIMKPQPARPPQQEFTEDEAAVFLGISKATLSKLRRAGRGPECYSRAAYSKAILGAYRRGGGTVSETPMEDAVWTGGKAVKDDLRYRRETLEATLALGLRPRHQRAD